MHLERRDKLSPAGISWHGLEAFAITHACFQLPPMARVQTAGIKSKGRGESAAMLRAAGYANLACIAEPLLVRFTARVESQISLDKHALR